MLTSNRDDAIQLGNGERPHDHRIHAAEDSYVGADADSKRDHGSQRESRRFPQLANGIKQILKQRMHPDLPKTVFSRQLSDPLHCSHSTAE